MNNFQTNLEFNVLHNGCDAAIYDVGKIKNDLLEHGLVYRNEGNTDILIYYACTFTNERERFYLDQINGIKNNHDYKLIIITGCFFENNFIDENIVYCKKSELLKVINNRFAINNYYQKELSQIKNSDNFYVPISISEGCNGNCSYCSIRLVRGKHYSYPIENIVTDIKSSQSPLIKLVGQDILEYGKDIGLSFTHLLQHLFDQFPSIKFLLGSLNPRILKKYSKSELGLFAHENIAGNIHIPIESASNKVLRHMKRGYTIEDWVSIYTILQELGVKKISTDLICGYFSETEFDHSLNLNFLDTYSFSFCQIFKFDLRPGILLEKQQNITNHMQVERTVEAITYFVSNYLKNNNIKMADLEDRHISIPYNTNIKLKEIFK